MKYTIEGFNQEYALSLKKEVKENGKIKKIKIDCIDLVILRWFVDFYPNMTKMQIDGVEYVWVNYQSVLNDLPLLDIKKQTLSIRLQKFVEFQILEHQTVKKDGTFSYYKFGKNYKYLISTVDKNINTVSKKIDTGLYKNNERVSKKIDTGNDFFKQQNNSSIKYTSIKDSSIKYNNICSESKATEQKSSEVIINLVLNDKSLYPVYQEDIDKYKELYQAVDVVQEFRKMVGWLDANPTRRKTRAGIKRFINAWLSKKQDKGGNLVVSPRTTTLPCTTNQEIRGVNDYVTNGNEDPYASIKSLEL